MGVGDSTREPGRRGPGAGSRRRAELLAIAADLFATRGFVATTVREIAEEAGILSGSLYHHFDSKESMVDEILRAFLDAQREAFDRIVTEHDDPRTTLTELVRQSFDALHRHRAAVAILQNEGRYLAQFGRFAYVGRTINDFERTWVRVLRDGQQAGLFRQDLNVKLAHRFVRDSVAASVQWYNPRGRLSLQSVADQYIRIFCDGIVTPSAATDTDRTGSFVGLTH